MTTTPTNQIIEQSAPACLTNRKQLDHNASALAKISAEFSTSFIKSGISTLLHCVFFYAYGFTVMVGCMRAPSGAPYLLSGSTNLIQFATLSLVPKCGDLSQYQKETFHV